VRKTSDFANRSGRQILGYRYLDVNHSRKVLFLTVLANYLEVKFVCLTANLFLLSKGKMVRISRNYRSKSATRDGYSCTRLQVVASHPLTR
jgi:hypothetical protein